MDEYRQNLIVGSFVLVGMIILGTLIILFGEAPYTFTPSYKVTMIFPSAGPISKSDPIVMNGIQIGFVKDIEPMEDIRQGVKIICLINSKYRIPQDAEPLIKEQTVALGKPTIRINVGPSNKAVFVPTDGTGILRGYVAGGIEELIPKETMKQLEEAGTALIDLAKALRPVADDLHELLRPISIKEVDKKAAQGGTTGQETQPLANVSTAVQRLDLALKNLNEILSDPENKNNIALIAKNFKTVSEKGIELAEKFTELADRLNKIASKTDTNIEKLTNKLIENTNKLSDLLSQLNSIAYKLNEGKGTAGRLLNDPDLYEGLSDAFRQLKDVLEELHILIMQWQSKGIKIEGGLIGK